MTDAAQTVAIITNEMTGEHYWFAKGGAEGGPFKTIAEAEAAAKLELIGEVSEAELPHILSNRDRRDGDRNV